MQQATENPIKYEIVCRRLNPAKMICVSVHCEKSAACCIKEDCEVCREAHIKCKVLRTQLFLKKVTSKKQKLTDQILKGIQAMQKAYDEAIDRLSKDRQYITSQMDMLGYNETEVEFMRLLQDGLADQITGKMNATILKDYEIKRDWVATQQTISKYWQRKEKGFNQLFNKFKNVMKIGIPKLESKITEDTDLIMEYFGQDKQVQSFTLLYRASENAFQVSQFHQACDGKRHTLVLARTQFKRIIGGYTPCEWSQNSSYGTDTERASFLFSLTNNEKYPITQTMYANYGGPSYGPTFGGGHDFYITNNANTQTSNYFNFPHSYNNGKYNAGQQAQMAFCGSPNNYNARIQEWEVFQVQFF